MFKNIKRTTIAKHVFFILQKTKLVLYPDNISKSGSGLVRIKKKYPDTGSGKSLIRNAPACQRQKFSGSGPIKNFAHP